MTSLASSRVKIVNTNVKFGSKNLVVIVDEENGLPPGVVWGPYLGDFDFGRTVFREEEHLHFESQAHVIKYDIYRMNSSSNHWLPFVKSARDHHEQNAEFFKKENGEIFLKTTKFVKSKELLLAWFSEELSANIGIPFLTLGNIKGHQSYVCHRCGEVFRYPNPLKSHIRFHCKMPGEKCAFFRPFLDCDTNSNQTQLQIDDNSKSKSTLNAKDLHERNIKSNAFILPSISKKLKDKSRAYHMDCDAINKYQQLPPYLYWSQQRDFTANLPIPTISITSHGIGGRDPYGSWTCTWKRSGRCSETTVRPCPRDSTSDYPLPTETDGEPLDLLPKSFFANKSQRGHLCIYCGKLYSRKYGLKIHLRTHTGYKPLKCKVCLRPFGDPSNLNKHIRLHAQGNTPYKCQHCGKILVRRRDLERHIRSRHEPEFASEKTVTQA